MSSELAKFTRLEMMTVELSETTDFVRVAQIRDEAEAFSVWVKARENGKELARKAKVIVLTAERRIGELSREIPRKPGRSPGPSKSAQLRSVGINANRSQRAEKIAAIPQEKFQEYIQTAERPSPQGLLTKYGGLEVRPATIQHVTVWRDIARDAIIALEHALRDPREVSSRRELADLRKRFKQAIDDQGREDRRSVYWRREHGK
jgi:hypothetical protein